MPSHLLALCFGANDPLRLAHFWAGVLGWEMADDPRDGIALLPSDDTGFRIRFLATQEQKTGPNRMHFDLTSTSLDDQQETVARSLGLGARHIDVGQRAEEGHVVLADPEGNEFCVIEPGNDFLADCGFVGALACDGSQEVGYFWSQALGWPLVWDQDQETAIRSPHGGPKITWGGPPLMPRTGGNRLHFDLAPPAHGDQQAEVERLVSLGATRIGIGQGEVGWVVMADPDGNEFCVLTPARLEPGVGDPPIHCADDVRPAPRSLVHAARWGLAASRDRPAGGGPDFLDQPTTAMAGPVPRCRPLGTSGPGRGIPRCAGVAAIHPSGGGPTATTDPAVGRGMRPPAVASHWAA